MEGAAEWSATDVEYRGARESVGVRFLHLPQCAAIVVAPQPVNSVGRVPGLHPGCGGSRPSRATGHIWGCLSRPERPPCKRAVGVRVPASPRCSRPGGIGWNRCTRKHRRREPPVQPHQKGSRHAQTSTADRCERATEPVRAAAKRESQLQIVVCDPCLMRHSARVFHLQNDEVTVWEPAESSRAWVAKCAASLADRPAAAQ